jgi:hypothetical protein
MRFKEFLSENVIVKNQEKIQPEKVELLVTAIPKMLATLRIPDVKIFLDFDSIRPDAFAVARFGGVTGGVTFATRFMKKATDHQLLDTLAHELIHIWQANTLQLDDRDKDMEDKWWFGGKQHNTKSPWAHRPWEQQAVLNSWQLVQKSGLADLSSRRSHDGKSFKANRLGREAKLHIKHLYDE